jgi:hypothetical protein
MKDTSGVPPSEKPCPKGNAQINNEREKESREKTEQEMLLNIERNKREKHKRQK